MKKMLLWDLPARVFHWTLVVFVASAIVTGEIGSDLAEYHSWLGFSILTLLVFRLTWSFFGGRYSRYPAHWDALKQLPGYLSGKGAKKLGYSPLGALALLVFIPALWTMATTGLFVDDDMDFVGPLNHLVRSATGDKLTGIHKFVGTALIVLVLLHVCTIVFYYFVKKDNRVLPMIFGVKEVPHDTPDDHAGTYGHPALALVLLLFSAGGVWYLVTQV